MKRTFLLACLSMSIFGSQLSAQPAGPGNCCGAGCGSLAGNPKIELKGKVARVQITPGEGMPSVEIKADKHTTKVHLGSMRYLMTQGFNPKVDDEITVKGFKVKNEVIAITVTLQKSNRTLQLRDENGCPVWRGGWR